MLSDKALLANLTISMWGARKKDKRATATVENTHSTGVDAGQYTKKLLPGASELKEISRVASVIRLFYYEQTLPWCSDGSRILSGDNYMDFVARFNSLKQEYATAVSAFLAVYPMLREQARLKLGDLFNEAEYPSDAELRDAFACDVSFMPLPSVTDFRIELGEHEKRAFVESIQTVERNAARECWQRLYDVVSHAATRLSDPKASVHESVRSNVMDMCSLLPKLNVMDDPALETMRREVEASIANVSTEQLKTSPIDRTRAANALAGAMDKMGAFMGSMS